MIHPCQIGPIASGTRACPAVRRVVTALAALVAALCLTASAGSTVASAYTSSAVPNLGGAISYGFACDGTNNWVRQNWPNILTASSVNQTVYVRSFLYRWTASGWALYRTGNWYSGVSNNTGKKQIGRTLGGTPYYFALAGNPSSVPPTTGVAFTSLPDGYYTTVEQYQVAGRQWSSQNYVQSASEDYSTYYCAI